MSRPKLTIEQAKWIEYLFNLGRQVDRRDRFKRMIGKHIKWPLGMPVMVKTPQGYLPGKVSRHDRYLGAACWIDFSPALVDIHDEKHLRHSNIVSFRNIKPAPTNGQVQT